MDQILKNFKEKLARGESVYGPFMKTGDPMFAEAAGLAGFDFVILDTEHGPVSLEHQQNNIRAAQVAGAVPVIRVPNMEENTIGSALDIGAYGVQVPQVKDAAQAKSVVQSARFYPAGERGVCRYVRAAEYSRMDKKTYFKESENTLVILQLEGQEAIDNLDGILAVDGIDILFIGPYDLSQSLGVPGEVESDLVIDTMKGIISRAKAKGKVIGTFVDNIKMLRLWRDAGVQYISYSVDVGIFSSACASILSEINDGK